MSTEQRNLLTDIKILVENNTKGEVKKEILKLIDKIVNLEVKSQPQPPLG